MKGRLNGRRTGAGILVCLALYSLAQALPSSRLVANGAGASASAMITAPPSTPPNHSSASPVGAGVTLAQPDRVIPAGRSSVHVPILMYHYIRVNPDPHDRFGFNLSVTPADFSLQMGWLASQGFHPVDLRDVRDYLFAQGSLPVKPVIISLDDGYRDLYTAAYPVLKEHHFKAVAYIVSGFLGGPDNVTREQVLEMAANRIEIGSHSVSHADLTKLSAEDLRRQLQDSKLTLEALLGHPVLNFCYPAGAVSPTVLQAVQAAGYETATTTAGGTVHSASDRYLWTRVRVSGGESLTDFASRLGPEEPSELSSARGQPPTFEPNAPTQVGLPGELLP